jgi:hypothetical protein
VKLLKYNLDGEIGEVVVTEKAFQAFLKKQKPVEISIAKSEKRRITDLVNGGYQIIYEGKFGYTLSFKKD